MPTRLKRRPFWRPFALTVALLAFQGYLGYSVFNGQFGTESQKQMTAEIGVLEAQSNALGAEIDAYKHRAALFDPVRLDPDILSERARALLDMAHPDDVVVMIDPGTSKPKSGSSSPLASDKLTAIIQDIPD